MFKRNSLLAVSLLTTCYLPQAMARPLATDAGWGVTLNVNGGFAQLTSQMNPDSDNNTTADLNNAGQEIDKYILFPMARAAYTLSDLKTQVFFGNNLEGVSHGQFQLELGAAHQFADDSKITLAWFPKLPSFNKTWQDPYLVNQARQKTKQKSQGGRLAWDNIGGSVFSFKYGFANNTLNDETSGTGLALASEEKRLLDRNTDYHRVSFEMQMPLGNQLFFEPALTYTLGDADGKAMRYNEYGTRLSLTKVLGQHRISGNAFYSEADFDARNPVFDRTRKDEKWGLFAFYSYSAPFNWQNTHFTLMGAWGKADSNIKFYETELLSLVAGMAYQF